MLKAYWLCCKLCSGRVMVPDGDCFLELEPLADELHGLRQGAGGMLGGYRHCTDGVVDLQRRSLSGHHRRPLRIYVLQVDVCKTNDFYNSYVLDVRRDRFIGNDFF